eukprot:COSAG06_NODE_5648_length_3342_cov_1.867407_3_plen_325_part_00
MGGEEDRFVEAAAPLFAGSLGEQEPTAVALGGRDGALVARVWSGRRRGAGAGSRRRFSNDSIELLASMCGAVSHAAGALARRAALRSASTAARARNDAGAGMRAFAGSGRRRFRCTGPRHARGRSGPHYRQADHPPGQRDSLWLQRRCDAATVELLAYATFLQMWSRGFKRLRAAIPAATIVGPSIWGGADPESAPGNKTAGLFNQWLDETKASDTFPSVLSWHVLYDSSNTDYNPSPAWEVPRLQSCLKQRGLNESGKLMINEYGGDKAQQGPSGLPLLHGGWRTSSATISPAADRSNAVSEPCHRRYSAVQHSTAQYRRQQQ